MRLRDGLTGILVGRDEAASSRFRFGLLLLLGGFACLPFVRLGWRQMHPRMDD